MKLEQKDVSPRETLLYLTKPLLLMGAFYQNEHPILQNMLSSGLISTVMLTADFLYLKSTNAETLSDAKMLAIAELDDYVAIQEIEETAPINNLETKIALVLKLIIAPILEKDGGNIELESYQNGTASVRFLGKCNGCPYAKNTLKNHVEKNLIRYFPQIKEAVLV